MKRTERHRILFSSSDFRSILAQWIDEEQKSNPELNKKKIGELLHFSSQSTLYDILKGRRAFPLNKVSLLQPIFCLESEEIEYLSLLLQLEKENDGEKCDQIYLKLEKITKYLGFINHSLSDQLKTNIFAMQVFSALGLFDGEPTFNDLLVFFGRNRVLDLERAIQILYNEQLIFRDNQKYKYKNNNATELSFRPSTIDLVRTSLLDSAIDIMKPQDPSESFFVSRIIACKAENIPKFINEFRNNIFKHLLQLEHNNGDVLMKVISASYPVFSTEESL